MGVQGWKAQSLSVEITRQEPSSTGAQETGTAVTKALQTCKPAPTKLTSEAGEPGPSAAK